MRVGHTPEGVATGKAVPRLGDLRDGPLRDAHRELDFRLEKLAKPSTIKSLREIGLWLLCRDRRPSNAHFMIRLG